MTVAKTVRRLNARQAESRREQLRQEQFRREQLRKERSHKVQLRRDRVDGIKGGLVLLIILALFALVYWLAVSNAIPAAY